MGTREEQTCRPHSPSPATATVTHTAVPTLATVATAHTAHTAHTAAATVTATATAAHTVATATAHTAAATATATHTAATIKRYAVEESSRSSKGQLRGLVSSWLL